MITNDSNGKIYIGKTKEMYGKGKFGINGRLKKHICDAYSKNHCDDCPLLYRAIRKYGKENFSIEKILNCDIDEYDQKETDMILLYNSTDKNIGYNIALGGKGRSVVNVSEDIRQKISSSQNNGDNEMNLLPVIRKDKLVGYKIRRREQGKPHNKWFTPTKFTSKENLNSAKKWLENFKKNIPNESTKESKLPKNISYLKNKKGEKAGYRVNILQNGIRYDKSFQDCKYNMKEKLEKATEYKNNILNAK